MKGISDIAYNKQQEYREKYKQWCIENPGSVMCNYTQLENGCSYAIHCDTIADLDVLIKVFKGKAESIKGVQGFSMMKKAVQEIKDEYIKECELQYFL